VQKLLFTDPKNKNGEEPGEAEAGLNSLKELGHELQGAKYQC